MEITIKTLHLHYRVWIELRKLRTHPLLLVPGWTGFFIKVRDNIVVIQSTIGYLDTLDSPATDLKTAYEVLCLGCEIKERLKLKAVACVFDQAFYAKAMEVFWKHRLPDDGWVSSPDDDAGLRDVAVQSEIVTEGSIDSMFNSKHYNQAVRLHKIIYEAIVRLLVEDFEH